MKIRNGGLVKINSSTEISKDLKQEEKEDWVFVKNSNEQPSHRKSLLNINLENMNNKKIRKDEKLLECAICLDERVISDIYIINNCYHKFCTEVYFFKNF